jgi:hypothetical protein
MLLILDLLTSDQPLSSGARNKRFTLTTYLLNNLWSHPPGLNGDLLITK